MSSTENPGLIAGHAKYVKGAAEEVIGNATSSEAWQKSGADGKQAGLEEMRAANENRDGAGGGRVEELAGKAVGCEGMEKEGKESQASS